MPTAHIKSKKEDISNLVIMPGDPNRCKYIAENYLEDAKLVNQVRGALAYTGLYKNKRVTVFTSGMGIPSMGIYSYELFKFYDVDTIIRIGTAGAYKDYLNVGDIVLANSSYSMSGYTYEFNKTKEDTLYGSDKVNEVIKETARELNINLNLGKVHSTSAFYTIDFDFKTIDAECVEMETFSLFANAKELNKNASCLLTISNSFITNQEMSSNERETRLNDMIVLALEAIIKL